ncbi:MAG: virulence factor BrkB family protein [Chromatiales bacterium]|jgi:membrane protein
MKRIVELPQHFLPFMQLLFSRFMSNNSLQNAAAMTYTTLLSLVPLMAVSIAIFSAFPIADRISEAIQDFVFQNFMPASGDVLQSYFDEFSGKASKMTGTGFIFLILVALMLMANIDRAFNTIWRVKRKRGPINQFMVYWAVLSLGPILIAVSIAVTSYIVTLPFLTGATSSGIGRRLLGLTPVLVSSLAFMLMYAIVPNRPVPLRHAFMGGLLAAVLFELAKRGFGFYVTNFPTYEAIYGALATIPIFLVWLYLSWLVTLLGAEFTYCLSVYGRQKTAFIWQGDKLLDALQVLARLWQAQQRGDTLSLHQMADEISGYTEERLENLLMRLQYSKLVLNTAKYNWALARDLSHVTLADLYAMRPFILPQQSEIDAYDGPCAEGVREIMSGINGEIDTSMRVPLDQLFAR